MRIRTLVIVLAGLLAVSAGLTTARAQSNDRRTFFEFSGPVSVPGVTLPAGKYIFRVASTTQRDVLQVLSADGKKSFAQFFALRAYRRESVPVPEVRFMETPAGVPPAIDTWWHPSELVGYEFIYPERQKRLLATAPDLPPAPVREVEPSPTTAEARVTPPPVTGEPAPEWIPVVEPEPMPPAEPAQVARVELPRTASRAPLVMMVALALLLTAGALGAVRHTRG